MSGRMRYKWRMPAAAAVKDLATVVVLVALLALGCAVSVKAADKAAPPSLSFDSTGWSATASPNLASHPPSTKDLENFLNPLLESAGQIDPDIGEGEYICSFAFKDLRHDGFLSLIAGVGVPDRPSCRDVYIIDKNVTSLSDSPGWREHRRRRGRIQQHRRSRQRRQAGIHKRRHTGGIRYRVQRYVSLDLRMDGPRLYERERAVQGFLSPTDRSAKEANLSDQAVSIQRRLVFRGRKGMLASRGVTA